MLMLQTMLIAFRHEDSRNVVRRSTWQTVQTNGMCRHLANFDALIVERHLLRNSQMIADNNTVLL